MLLVSGWVSIRVLQALLPSQPSPRPSYGLSSIYNPQSIWRAHLYFGLGFS